MANHLFLRSLHVRGFASILDLPSLHLHRGVNLVLGASGAGKSNLLDVFRLASALLRRQLRPYVSRHGGADDLLFLGPELHERQLELRLEFDSGYYQARLVPTPNHKLALAAEKASHTVFDPDVDTLPADSTVAATPESTLLDHPTGNPRADEFRRQLQASLGSYAFYHFCSTCPDSPMRQPAPLAGREHLAADGGNIAAFLLWLKQTAPRNYTMLVRSVQVLDPLFADFAPHPLAGNDDLIQLDWHQTGFDAPLKIRHLPDGTLRFICLAAALLQPQPPALLLIDEPELGLHPSALTLLADFLRLAAEESQVLVATQSLDLATRFAYEELIASERDDYGISYFAHLDKAQMDAWLRRYASADWDGGHFAAAEEGGEVDETGPEVPEETDGLEPAGDDMAPGEFGEDTVAETEALPEAGPAETGEATEDEP